ncbi:MAG: type III pantothenate kinase [Anaerolineae bacterium]|nr:type III pantothenate kinase [Anaerolineae bacterium]
MLLCIDVGNTNIVLGLYDGDNLRHHWRISTDDHKMPDEYAVLLLELFANGNVRLTDVEGAIVASVVPPLTGTFQEVCQGTFGSPALVVDAGVKTGVRIRTDNPREVGADLVVDAAAAYRLYGGPACVVDFGTATKFSAVSEAGDFLGCAIAPGLRISAEALYRFTAKLPRIDLARPPSAIGRNTVHSMQSGLVFGFADMVEGMVARFRRELGDQMLVIATGGLAPLIAQETNVIKVVDPWLTLKGLRIIWDLNRA